MLYTNLLSTVAFFGVFLAWAISECLGPVRWSSKPQAKQREHRSLLLAFVTGVPGVLLALLFPLLIPGWRIPWQPGSVIVGIGLVLVGVGIRWWAMRTLGRYFTAQLQIQQDHRLVQHGPYKLVRHPSYSGVLLVITGLGLMIGNWASLLLLVAGMVLGLSYRIPLEEKTLAKEIEGYSTYMLHTKKLLPFVF